MKCLLLITLICLIGCNGTAVKRSDPAVSPQAPRRAKSANATPPAYRLAPPNLDCGFSLRSFFDWPIGKPVQVHIESRLAGDSEIRVYRVMTPVAFLSHLKSLDPVVFSSPIIENLALARGQRQDYWSDPPPGLPEISSFELVHHQPFQCNFNEQSWQRHTVTLSKDFEQGIYLVETRIGPQIAYLPFVVSTFDFQVFSGNEQTIAWLVDIASGKILRHFPIFYQQKQYDWHKKITNGDGLLTLNRSLTSGWLLPWDRQRIHCRPLFRPGQSDRPINIDRKDYLSGEPIIVHHPQEQSPTFTLGPASTGNILPGKRLAKQVSVCMLPSPLSPGKYTLKNPDAEAFAIQVRDTRPATEYIQLPQQRQVFPPGTSLAIEIYSAMPQQQAEVELLYRQASGQWQTIARQRKSYRNGHAQLYFKLERPGWYRLQSVTTHAEVYVTGSEKLERIVPIKRAYHRQELTLPVLVPGKEVEQLLVARDGDRLLGWRRIERFTGQRMFELPGGQINQELRISVFYWQRRQMIEETWQFPALIGDFILGQTLITANTPLSLPLKVNGKTYGIVWRQNGLPPLPAFTRRQASHLETGAAGSTEKALYQQWARQELLKNYSRALTAYQQRQYNLAIRYATATLQLAPEHDGATQLLAAAADKSNPRLRNQSQFKADLIGRLQTTIIPNLPQAISLSELVQRLTDASGVYIELDPDVLTTIAADQRKITDLPAGEPALSLLEYVLGKRELTWKLEHGVIFIVSRKSDLSRDLLADLDRRVDRQLQRPIPANGVAASDHQKQQQYLWHGKQASRQTVPINFPTPGIWTLWVKCLDNQQRVSRYYTPVLVLPAR